MEITTTPSCRVGSEGQVLHYIVRANGASEVSLPDDGTDAFEVRIANTRQVADGVEAELEVTVRDATPY